MIKFSCMLCGEKLSAPDQFAGKRIKCPKCDNTSVVPAESPRIRFECKNCGKGIRVLQIHAGKEGKCPQCKSSVVVPSVKVSPGEDPGAVTVVCSMCNERFRAPRDSKEKFMECPACGSNVESSLAGEPPVSVSPIPPEVDEDEYDESPDLPEEDEGPDRRIIFAICGAAAVVVVGLIILVTVILPSGSEPVEAPDISPPQQATSADSARQPVASDTQSEGTFNLEPPKEDTLPEESVSLGQVSLEQTKIVFVSNRDGNGEIYVMNADGSGQKNLTNSPAYDGYPCWSRDGKRIAFVSDSDGDGNGEIHVMNSDGSDKKKLTDDPTANLYPVWSPAGKIAFTSLRDGNPEIYVMNGDGREQKRLTRNSLIDESPCWSPDGKKIAFLSKRDEIQDIYVMNADGSEQVNLTYSPAEDGFPSWSPDGKKIAFTSGDDRNTDIYVMNADGTAQENVTNSPAMDGFPCYSPDGKKIVFWSTRGGGVDIYAMRVDGSELQNLTNNPSADMFPSWSPFLGSEPLLGEQSAADRKIDLKLRLKPGAKRRLRLYREFNTSVTVKGQQQGSSGALTTELEFEVEQVDANGVMSLKVTHLRFHETETEGEQKQYDSSKPDTLGNSHFGYIFSALIGRSFFAKVTCEGKIVELGGLAQMYQHMAEPLLDYQDEATRLTYPAETAKQRLDAANRKFASREERIEATRDKLDKGPYTRAENIRDMLGEVIMSFPGGPVGIGDSWTAAPSSMEYLGDHTYTLRENKRAAVLVDISAKVDVDDERPASADGSRGSSRTTLTGSGQGSVEIDPGTGWMLRKNMTLRYSGETRRGPTKRDPRGKTVAQSMESTTTVEPLDAN